MSWPSMTASQPAHNARMGLPVICRSWVTAVCLSHGYGVVVDGFPLYVVQGRNPSPLRSSE
jgi:hypothetical protein